MAGWRIVRGLAPAVLFWMMLVGWLAYALYARTQWWRQSDEANLREWLDESRVFRKALPELVREYVMLCEEVRDHPDDATRAERAANKSDEIREQLTTLADPTRMYQGQLPLFPEIYRLEVRFADPSLDSISWDSPLPRPRRQNNNPVQELDYPILGDDGRARMRCEYRMHAFTRIRRDEEDRQKWAWLASGLVLAAGAGALVWVYLFFRRERERELKQLRVQQEMEHARTLLLEAELKQREAEHQRDEAERAALELKSQIYANIGIMAGSYAHNIKNLLVRPNDLLSRCLEVNGLSGQQESMLNEARRTLGTVTERLQQILRTVRRDPNRTELTRLDLAGLLRDSHRTWAEMAQDKWKLALTVETPSEPLPLDGDLSHLQQAIENLVFNARDATFEMRNQLRVQARKSPPGSDALRRGLLEAAAWKGHVSMRVYRDGPDAVLEVRDNGIGMTPEVRERCTQAHFTTKRDNALYEGYSAGMGLGLSFVAVVLDHHKGRMEIDSEPLKGTTFRLRFPMAT